MLNHSLFAIFGNIFTRSIGDISSQHAPVIDRNTLCTNHSNSEESTVELLGSKENSNQVSLKNLKEILVSFTVLPDCLCEIIAEFAILCITFEYPEIIARRTNAEFYSDTLKSILSLQNGFRIQLQCLLPPSELKPSWGKPYRLITIKSQTQIGSPYLALSFKYYKHHQRGTELKLLIYMRSLHRVGDKMMTGVNMQYYCACCDLYEAGHKSMLFSISKESMRKYSNEIVDIECVFQWTGNNDGYKILVGSSQLKFVHFDRDRIARVKHLSRRTLENVTIMNGKKYTEKRPYSKCIISSI